MGFGPTRLVDVTFISQCEDEGRHCVLNFTALSQFVSSLLQVSFLRRRRT